MPKIPYSRLVSKSLGKQLATPLGGPLMAAFEAPEIAGNIKKIKFLRKRMGGSMERRLSRAQAITGVPFKDIGKKYLKESPSGPLTSVVPQVGGAATGFGAAALLAPLGLTGPPGWAADIGAFVGGEWLGRKALTKLLKPIDKKLFGKQIARTAKIRNYLERYRNV